jgi:hypothetical protein
MPTNRPRVSVQLDLETAAWLQVVAARRGISVSLVAYELIRQGLREQYPAARDAAPPRQEDSNDFC